MTFEAIVIARPPPTTIRTQVVGITVESEGAGRASVSFTPAEEEKFLAMSRTPDIYQKMASSISPSISGDYTVDIKRALACLLFGGSRKVCCRVAPCHGFTQRAASLEVVWVSSRASTPAAVVQACLPYHTNCCVFKTVCIEFLFLVTTM